MSLYQLFATRTLLSEVFMGLFFLGCKIACSYVFTILLLFVFRIACTVCNIFSTIFFLCIFIFYSTNFFVTNIVLSFIIITTLIIVVSCTWNCVSCGIIIIILLISFFAIIIAVSCCFHGNRNYYSLFSLFISFRCQLFFFFNALLNLLVVWLQLVLCLVFFLFYLYFLSLK